MACTRIVASLHTPTGRLRSARWPAASKNRSSRRRRRIDRDGTRLSPWLGAVDRGRESFGRRAWGDGVVAAVGRGSRGTARARRPGAARGRRVPGRQGRGERRRLGACSSRVRPARRCRPRRPLRVLVGLRPAERGPARPRRRVDPPGAAAARRRRPGLCRTGLPALRRRPPPGVRGRSGGRAARASPTLPRVGDRFRDPRAGRARPGRSGPLPDLPRGDRRGHGVARRGHGGGHGAGGVATLRSATCTAR